MDSWSQIYVLLVVKKEGPGPIIIETIPEINKKKIKRKIDVETIEDYLKDSFGNIIGMMEVKIEYIVI